MGGVVVTVVVGVVVAGAVVAGVVVAGAVVTGWVVVLGGDDVTGGVVVPAQKIEPINFLK